MFTAATCYRISGPANGGVNYETEIGANRRIPVGKKANYYCNHGYTQHGAQFAYCQSTDYWVSNGGSPECRRKQVNGVFLNVQWIQWQKIKNQKEDFRIGTQDLLCKRQRWYQCPTETHVTVYWTQFMPHWFLRFPEFTEFNESSAPFRENPNLIFS